jgi:transcriptional accessory protein Tex/SPT6
VGQRVKVRVMGVDLQRNRIALSMKSDAGAPAARGLKPADNAPRAPKLPKAPAFTPKSGAIAPNGMRFK